LSAGTQLRTVEIINANKKLTQSATLANLGGGVGTLTITGFNWGALGFVPGVDRRPDGNDLLFGGAGTQISRNNDVHLGTAATEHARDADTIVGDNGRIIRIVGTNNTDLAPSGPTSQRYVRFVYDNYSSAIGYDENGKIVVRGVTLIDYTPGGPDFLPFNGAGFGV